MSDRPIMSPLILVEEFEFIVELYARDPHLNFMNRFYIYHSYDHAIKAFSFDFVLFDSRHHVRYLDLTSTYIIRNRSNKQTLQNLPRRGSRLLLFYSSIQRLLSRRDIKVGCPSQKLKAMADDQSSFCE